MAQKEEHSHRESEEKFAKAFRCSPQPFTLSTLKEDRYIEVNDAFELKTGYRREEVIGRTVDELGIWVDYAERGKLVEKIVRGEPIRNVECRFRKKTGEVFIGLLSAELLELAGEMCVVANAIDITDWRRTEEALRISEERLRLAQQAARIGAFERNVRTGVVTWSTDLEPMYGLQPGTFDGTTTAFFQNLIHPDDHARVTELVDRASKTGQPMTGEWRVLWPDGSIHWIDGRWQVFMDESGEPSRVVGVNMDVTERKRTEEALRESEDKLRLLLDSTAEAIYGIDLEHRCTFCNPAFLSALGYEHMDEVLGKNMHDLIHHTRADGTSFPVEECGVHRVTRTGEGVRAEDEMFWRANGTSFPAEYWSYPQRRGEEVVGAAVAFVDITERKLAEAALANVSRKLIEAQEEERTRIARELHDDIGQRLALLAIEMEQLHQDPLIVRKVRRRMGKLQEQISRINAWLRQLDVRTPE